jgi:hypothetical protein
MGGLGIGDSDISSGSLVPTADSLVLAAVSLVCGLGLVALHRISLFITKNAPPAYSSIRPISTREDMWSPPSPTANPALHGAHSEQGWFFPVTVSCSQVDRDCVRVVGLSGLDSTSMILSIRDDRAVVMHRDGRLEHEHVPETDSRTSSGTGRHRSRRPARMANISVSRFLEMVGLHASLRPCVCHDITEKMVRMAKAWIGSSVVVCMRTMTDSGTDRYLFDCPETGSDVSDRSCTEFSTDQDYEGDFRKFDLASSTLSVVLARAQGGSVVVPQGSDVRFTVGFPTQHVHLNDDRILDFGTATEFFECFVPTVYITPVGSVRVHNIAIDVVALIRHMVQVYESR